MSSIQEIFFIETEELLTVLENGLIALEDDSSPEVVNDVFRAAHTIKSNAGIMNLTPLVDLTHVMENLLDKLRDDSLKVTKDMVSALLEANDVLKAMFELASIGGDLQAAVKPMLIEKLGSFYSKTVETSVNVKEQIQTKREALVEYRIKMQFRKDLFDTGQAPEMLIEDLSELGTIKAVSADTSKIPSFDMLSVHELYISWELILETHEEKSTIENIFIFVVDDNKITIEPVEMEIASSKPEKLTNKEDATHTDLEEHSRKERTKLIRVETDKLDRLVDLVGELVISVAQVNQAIRSGSLDEQQATVEGLDLISRELQEQVMSLRMVPLEGTFSRFKRMIRDLAEELGKEVRMETKGTETELDKNVIEQLVDPLKHMIRNSIHHGLESPEERVEKGKPKEGTITLQAAQKGGNIIIEIKDDGRGINKQKVIEKAIERGMIKIEEQLSDSRVYSLMFEPGFSTANEINEISGRGVGLDVVRRNIESMRGRIEVESIPDKGTNFRLRLPLTLAIIDSMTVKVGSEVLSIPLLSIIQQLRPKREELKTVEGEGELVLVRGEYVPLLRLNRVFNLFTDREDPTQALVVVVENEGRTFGILVDDVLGQEQAVIKALDKNYKTIPGVSGATILGDGRISLIVDIGSVERMAFAIG